MLNPLSALDTFKYLNFLTDNLSVANIMIYHIILGRAMRKRKLKI